MPKTKISTRPVEGVPVSIDGRTAVCTFSHEDFTDENRRNSLMDSPQPSNVRLPFFEYRGPGSIWAETFCGTCGMGYTSHQRPGAGRQPCGAFVARGPAEFDAFYCGCRGLD